MRCVSSLQDWATAITELPTGGPLPARTVLVPGERVAHALRRALLERGALAALVGTRFVRLQALAAEIVEDAGETAVVDEAELMPLFVREAIAEADLARLSRKELLSLPGWDTAFVRTLSELEAAGVCASQLLAQREPEVRDVGRVLEALEQRDDLHTSAALLRRATTLAGARRGVDPVLAVVTGFESKVEADLLRALPGIVLARWEVRPVRPAHAARFERLFGPKERSLSLTPLPEQREAPRRSVGAREVDPATARSRALAPAARAPVPPTGERRALAALKERLFAEAEGEPAVEDDSVRIATYAGIHEEVEAAVGWVVEQVVSHGTPLGAIALLSPRPDLYAPLLRARLSTLPWSAGASPCFIEGGVPIVERSDGARLLAVVRALREGLSRDALAPLLPLLSARDEAFFVRGLSHAWELLNAVAITGGERATPRRGRAWPEAWESAVLRLETPQVASGALDEREERQRRELQRGLAELAPAIDALTDVLRHAVSGAPLGMVWMCLSTFAERHLKLPFAEPPALALLEQRVGRFEGREEHEPLGMGALAWIEAALRDVSVPCGRFGEPLVYIGSLAGVRGLSFCAVRVLGVIEGALPSASREDPLLPDALRAALTTLLPTAPSRAYRQLASFADAVGSARERLALSAPRVGSEGSTRQPAAVLLDVVRALAGTRVGHLERRLEEIAQVGRARERSQRELLPCSPASRLDRIARGDRALARAEHSPALALDALRRIADRSAPTAQDGLLAGVPPRELLSGLDPARPISASRLATLLSCPHRYLYEHLLGMREPSTALPTHALPANVFGSWLHDMAEGFWREHGPRRGKLPELRAALRAHASTRFDELRASYPFANEDVAAAQREQLCDQLDKLLELELGAALRRRFVAVERPFGYDAPCALETAAGTLYVRGKIDKLDVEGDTLLVRDIKTGGGKPRRAGEPPELSIDLQLGVYALVAKHLASAWETPGRVGVAYLYLRGGEPERAWLGDDYRVLEAATEAWLATARETLEHAAFVRTASPDDCRYCPHRAVCDQERPRAARVLEDPRVPRRLAVLKAREGS